MELLLKRTQYEKTCTKGELYVDGKLFDYTLEDVDRGLLQSMPLNELQERKIYGETAIPKGRYKVVVDYSNKFKKMMLHILNVPAYLGIRIHGGVNVSQTYGCPLIKKENSEKLKNMVMNLPKGEECWISIE